MAVAGNGGALVGPSPRDPDPGRRPSATAMERLALRLLRVFHRRSPPRRIRSLTHVLDEDERRAVRRIVRGAVLRAAVIGGCGAALIVLGQILCGIALGIPHEGRALADHCRYWACAGPVTLIITMAEILLLHAEALRSVHALSRLAGMAVFAGEDGDAPAAVAGALARAAFELPNPPEVVCGVDPRAEATGWRLLFFACVYKTKVGLSNILARTVIARLLGRSLLRLWVPLVAVPLTAVWAAWVARRVMREAQCRVHGPSAVEELLDGLLAAGEASGPRAGALIVRAVAAVVVRHCDMHPNLALLLLAIRRRLGVDAATYDYGSKSLLAELTLASVAERALVLRGLGIAAAVDGVVSIAERRLIRQAQQACGLSVDLAPFHRLCRAFLSGQAIPGHLVRDLAPS